MKKKELPVKQRKNNEKGKGKIKPRWKPGQSGNPKGRPKKKYSLVSLLKEALEKLCPADKKKRTWAEVLTESLLVKAAKGDMTAQKIIWEYIEGKPKQEIEIPSEIKINVNYVKRKT